ncbi:MAG: MFS transporter [Thermomicrobiales bacterium]|nr:MFS transporter [Thermomicrobiales bacterium]
MRLWSAASVSVFGTLITRTALPFTAILTLSVTPFQIGLLQIATLLPGFLIGLFAGVWIDRRRRRPVLVAADLGRAAALLTVPVAAIANALTLTHLLLVAAIVSVLDVGFDIAYQSYLPTLVHRDDLVEGNSKLTAAASVAEAISFGSGGWLVQVLTAPIAIAVDAVTFLFSALAIHAIRRPEELPAGQTTGNPPRLLSEMEAGIRVVLGDPLLSPLLAANAGVAFGFGVGGAAFLIYVNQTLGFDPGMLGLIFALGGIGSLGGALLAGRLAAAPLGTVLIGCCLIGALGQGLVPLATSAGLGGLLLLIAQQFISDPAFTILDINQVSLRQAITDPALFGRVNASFRAGEVGGQIIGALVGGIVGDLYGPRVALVVGMVGLLLAALRLVASPLRALRAVPAVATPPAWESA